MTTPHIRLNNGLDMPQLGFGVFQVPDEEATPAVAEALRVGYRSIDTAATYKNEAGVGRAIAESDIPREELFVTSKLWIDDLGYDSALAAYDETLKKMGLDYLDLYLIHWPAPETDNYLEAWRALEKLYNDGRVKAIGVSNFQPEHLERLLAQSEITPVVNQIELHPSFQNRALSVANDAANIATEAWSPLAQGQVLNDATVTHIAEAHNVTPAQVILRWHLQEGRIVIPKSVTPERIAENFDLFGFELSPEDLQFIDALDGGEGGRMGPNPSEFNG